MLLRVFGVDLFLLERIYGLQIARMTVCYFEVLASCSLLQAHNSQLLEESGAHCCVPFAAKVFLIIDCWEAVLGGPSSAVRPMMARGSTPPAVALINLPKKFVHTKKIPKLIIWAGR